jgi:hypothetical protein
MDGGDHVDALPIEVRRVEVQAEVRVWKFVEHRLPIKDERRRTKE